MWGGTRPQYAPKNGAQKCTNLGMIREMNWVTYESAVEAAVFPRARRRPETRLCEVAFSMLGEGISCSLLECPFDSLVPLHL